MLIASASLNPLQSNHGAICDQGGVTNERRSSGSSGRSGGIDHAWYGKIGVWDSTDTLEVRIKDETMTREFRLKIRESRFAANKKRWRGKGGLLLTSKKCTISHERYGDG